MKKLGGEGAGLRFQGWELAEKVREAGLISQALLSTTLRRTVLFHILSTCVSRALAAFGGSPLSQEAPDARAGEGSGARGQSPDLPAGLQLLPFPLQHISSRPGLVYYGRSCVCSLTDWLLLYSCWSLLRSNIYSRRGGGNRFCCLESCCVVGGSQRGKDP